MLRLQVRNESTSISEEDLQELQDRAAARRHLRDLFRRPAQAAARLEVAAWHA
jgi:hypothetical protein